MDFSLTEEQQLLQDSINQFIEREYTFDDRKKFLDSEKGFNEENWKTFGSLGWLGMPFSEDDGGYNGGPVDVMVIMENLGKGLIVEPYVPSILLSGKILADLGSDDQKSNYLHPMISGEKIITFAYKVIFIIKVFIFIKIKNILISNFHLFSYNIIDS